MKHLFSILLFLPVVAFAQPDWVTNMGSDAAYPREQYLTGFSLKEDNGASDFIATLKADAKAELIEGIVVSVKSAKEIYKSESQGVFSEDYSSLTSSFADADVNGLNVEYYYDNSSRIGYAFAYADKNEVRKYYQNSIAFTIRKIENAASSAKQFEGSGKKGQAKKIYEQTKPLFKELEFAQSLLIAIGSDEASIQTEKSLELKAEITLAVSRMQSAIVVYIKSRETNFDKPVKLLEPKLKAILSQRGCSYASDPQKADWILTVDASTREGREVEGVFFSYLDVTVSLVEQRTDKEIYSNNFTDLKGGGLDYITAGRKAYDASLQKIAEELSKSLEK